MVNQGFGGEVLPHLVSVLSLDEGVGGFGLLSRTERQTTAYIHLFIQFSHLFV
jgi:hypothetical protein